MVQAGTRSIAVSSAGEGLRGALAMSDRAIGSTGLVLRTLFGNEDRALFSDEILARVRGMVGHVARQLLTAMALESGAQDPVAAAVEQAQVLAEDLTGSSALLGHVHARAIEWQLAEGLQDRNGLDPVLSPLLQSLVASRDPGTAETAMAVLTAQVRFLQHGRRMELPLGELPAEIFHAALEALRTFASKTTPDAAERAIARLRGDYHESRSRLGLVARLVIGLGATVNTALAVDHAGTAIFLSALALAAGQDRDIVVLSTTDRHALRLALALSAAGLRREQVEAQFLFLQAGDPLPEGTEAVDAGIAAALLASSNPFDGA